MTATIDLSTAIDSADCDWPGCAHEAETQGRCRYHVGRQPLAARGGAARLAEIRHQDEEGRLIPGSLAHLMDDEPGPEPPAAPIVLCRVDGCTKPSVAQTGPWKGWCGEHKHLRGSKAVAPTPEPEEEPVSPPAEYRCKLEGCEEERADRAGLYGGLCATHKREKREANLAVRAAANPVKPPPVAKAAAPAREVPEIAELPPSLVVLAQAADDARAELVSARERHVQAVDALRAALDAAA